jgi:RimJ/RimL family protein N-acetyltransferase
MKYREPYSMPVDPLTDSVVLLRRPEDGDIEAVHRCGQDPDVEETAWLPVPFPCPREVAAGTVREFQRGWQGRYGLTLIIATPTAYEMRGVLHLSRHGDDAGEIAYGVAPRFRRLGLATRAVDLIALWAFSRLRLGRLEIVVTAPGIHGLASRRVAEKAGFSYAGMRRSHVPATGCDSEDPLYVRTSSGSG